MAALRKAFAAMSLALAASGGAGAAEFPLAAEPLMFAAPASGVEMRFEMSGTLEGRSVGQACAPAPGAMFPIGADSPCAPPQAGVGWPQEQ